MSEMTIYDRWGTPRAYIANDGKTIYMWRGEAVAYLVEEKVYGWSGTHLGWLVDGVMYDGWGGRIGFLRSRSRVIVSVSPVKSVKNVRSVKSVRSVACVRPVLSLSDSEEDLETFLTT